MIPPTAPSSVTNNGNPAGAGGGGGGGDDLLAALRAGDEKAFARLVDEHGGRMLALARRYLRDDEARAEDVVQDAFAAAFRGLPRFEGGCAIGTWLHAITVRAALMKLRGERRHRTHVVSIEALLPRFDADGHRVGAESAFAAPGAAAVGDGPEREELRALVRRCIDLLPDVFREVVVLRDIEQLDTEATARALDTTPGNVKVRLHRARQALREILQRHFTGKDF